MATLVRNFLLIWWSHLLHLLYYEAPHQVLEGVLSLIGKCIFFMVLEKFSIFSRADSTFFRISNCFSFLA